MARLGPLTVAEVDAAVKTWRADLAADRDRTPADLRSQLRELHDLLLRLTAGEEEPRQTLEMVAGVVATIDVGAVDRLPPRPRVVVRLLRAGNPSAAWQVLLDNATGVIDTGTGSAVARSPLRARVEAGAVYAELPGFRDPRFDAPDVCYDVTDRMRLRAQLDEIEVDQVGGVVRLAGWAMVDLLDSSPGEAVRVVLSDRDREVDVTADRVRRSDRRAWAGWSANVDVRSGLGIEPGRWGLSIEIDHDGIVRRTPLGPEASELARAIALGEVEVGDRTVRWDTSRSRWRLIIEDRRPSGGKSLSRRLGALGRYRG